MKITCKLTFDADLEATLPDGGVLGFVNPDAILSQASKLVTPMLHKALMGAIAQLAIIGVKVKVVNSSANFIRSEKE